MKKLVGSLLLGALLSGTAAFAGSFVSDFSNPNQSGYTLNQQTDGSGNSYPEITNDSLVLLPNEANIGQSAFVLNDLDNGSAIDSFNATFNLQMGPGTSTPADGWAFVFGPDVFSSTVFSEEGPSMPSGGVAVCFVVYSGDGPGIGVNVRVAGDGSALGGIVPGGFVPMPASAMVDTQMHPVSIQLKRNGTLDLVWNGHTIFTNLFLPGWAPVNGQFAMGGRNGGLSEQVVISNLVINTTLVPTNPPAPTVTVQPSPVSVHEGSSATFSVAFDGEAPITLQWMENNNPIPNATSNTLVLNEVSFTNNGAQIVCVLTNPDGTTNTTPATLTVIADTTAPTLQSVVADPTFTNLTLTFSEPVSDSALTLTNYQLGQGITVVSATRLTQTTIALGTSQMPSDTTLTLTVNGVQDDAATPNTIAANTKASFLTFTFLQGTVLHKVYYNCSPDGFTLNNLLSDPRYPNNPDRVDLATSWVWPPAGAGTYAADTNKSMFYDSLEGYFYPPATGDYVFYTVGDDEWYLYMSTNNNPANMLLVAEETGGWGNYLNWSTDQSGNLANWNTATFGASAWPTPNTLTLTKGQPYYMIMFHHDHSWSGGDQFAATFEQGAGDTTSPPNGTASTLIGSAIGFDFNPAGSSINFGQQPQSASIVEGAEATFSVAATGTSPYGTNVTYQWQILAPGTTTWLNITNATGQTLTTLPLALVASGTQYRVIANMATISSTSSVATVTVAADTTPPVLTAGAINGTNAGTVSIGIGFNKTIDDLTGGLAANYSVSSGTIIGFQWCSNRFTADSQNPAVMLRKQSALLTVSNFTGGTVTVKGVADTFGNIVTSTNIPVTLASNLSWGVVGANELGGWNAAVPVGPGAFDIYSDGISEWATYDETTFVYEQVTGDFDKVLRVQYQDGSSEWARAGIIARAVLNFGVDRATQTGSGSSAPPYDGLAGRYQKVHVNPVGLCLTGPGAQANANWEGNRRLDTGGPSDSALTNVNATPNYPDAWCRLQRVGQTFTIYRSPDGVNWEKLGQTTWGQDDQTKTPMPSTMYVGPEYSCENGNIPVAADQGTFLAQFRDYGDFKASVSAPTLTAGAVINGAFSLTYTGTLQSSTNVNGPYVAVPGAASPYSVNTQAAGGSKTLFFRASQ